MRKDGRTAAILFLAVFALSVCFFLAGAVFGKKETSVLENRTLTAFPELKAERLLSGEFQDQLEEALGDHMTGSETIRGTVRDGQAAALRMAQSALYTMDPSLRSGYTQAAEGYYFYNGDPSRIVEKPVAEGTGEQHLQALADQVNAISGAKVYLYEHEKTGLWIDVFPMEYSRTDPDNPAERETLAREIHAYYELYRKKLGRDPDRVRHAETRKRMISSLCGKEEAKSVIFASEFFRAARLQRKSDVLPLKRIAFEEIELSGPACPEGYLREQYGDYMRFPRSGILHHDGGRGPLENWARRSGIDMEEVIRTLEGMMQRI